MEKVRGMARDQIRTTPTVRDGIKIDRSADGLTPEERVGRIIGDLPSQKARYIKYEPGNGTRYDLVIVPLVELIPNKEGAIQYLVVLENFGRSMRARLGGCEHWDYIREKLGVTIPSAVALAELFEYLTTGANAHYGLEKSIEAEV